jgi:hypothetical protein
VIGDLRAAIRTMMPKAHFPVTGIHHKASPQSRAVHAPALLDIDGREVSAR